MWLSLPDRDRFRRTWDSPSNNPPAVQGLPESQSQALISRAHDLVTALRALTGNVLQGIDEFEHDFEIDIAMEMDPHPTSTRSAKQVRTKRKLRPPGTLTCSAQRQHILRQLTNAPRLPAKVPESLLKKWESGKSRSGSRIVHLQTCLVAVQLQLRQLQPRVSCPAWVTVPPGDGMQRFKVKTDEEGVAYCNSPNIADRHESQMAKPNEIVDGILAHDSYAPHWPRRQDKNWVKVKNNGLWLPRQFLHPVRAESKLGSKLKFMTTLVEQRRSEQPPPPLSLSRGLSATPCACV